MEKNNKNNYSKYFDLSENLIKSNNLCVIGSDKKGDVINRYLREEIERRKDLPYYDAIIAKLDKTDNKILENFYEVIKQDEKGGFIHIGNLENINKTDRTINPYSYNVNDPMLPRAVSIPIFFDKLTIGINEVTTTQVINGAILSCDVGTAPLQLLVTSQNSRYINDELVATERDIQKNINIMPQGTSCSLNKNKPCMEIMSPIKWESYSNGMTICDQHVLLNTSTCKCACGGTITIKDSKCKHVLTT